MNARQLSFASGEIAPTLWARTDMAKYANALRTCRNFVVLPTGGATTRPGLDFVRELKDTGLRGRLLKFVFSNSQTFALEFGNRTVRFAQNGAPVVVAGVPYEIASPYATADLQAIRCVQSGDVITLVHPLYPVYELKRLGNTNWTLTPVNFGSTITPPTGLALIPIVGVDHTYSYRVTAVSTATGEESIPSAPVASLTATPTLVGENKLTWNAVTDPLNPPPGAPIVTPMGGAGIIYWVYRIVAHMPQGTTDGSAIGFTATGVIDLAANILIYNHLIWPGLPGATSYDIYRSPGGPATSHIPGKIATRLSTGAAFEIYHDHGAPGDSSLPPAYASRYNLYVSQDYGPYGLLGAVTADLRMPPVELDDIGQVPNFLVSPPEPFTGFANPGDYPSVTGYYQGRQLYANTLHAPEKVWGSQSGKFRNFTVHTILQDDDAVIFQLANSEVAAVQHLLDLGKLILGSEGGEWLIEGGTDGILTPFTVNPRVGSYNGAKSLPPIKVDRTVLYVQALGSKVLELGAAIQYGYYTFTGRDLSLFSSHLFDGFTIEDWDYQQIPNYTTWAVRSDGTLLGFTYVADQELSAWHRHDTDGAFENVCCVPEGNEVRVYVIVRRLVNGVTRRYLERFRSLTVTDPAESSYMDAALEYDGRNAGAGGTTLTLTGGSTWAFDELLVLTASAPEFLVGNVGDARFLRDAVGVQVSCRIQDYVSPTVVHVYPNRTVPASLHGAAAITWDRAVVRVAGLGHLEAKRVAVFADGFVVASPNNPSVDVVTVASGTVLLDRPYAHIRVGLPYLSDLETLDIDAPSGPSLKEERLVVTRVGLTVKASRTFWAGRQAPTGTDATEDLYEADIPGVDPGSDATPVVAYAPVDIKGEWTSSGRIFIRQIDPVPLTVLAAMPMGFIPSPGGDSGR